MLAIGQSANAALAKAPDVLLSHGTYTAGLSLNAAIVFQKGDDGRPRDLDGFRDKLII
jgi:hypothetical protein